jgi:hypothetical protein
VGRHHRGHLRSEASSRSDGGRFNLKWVQYLRCHLVCA